MEETISVRIPREELIEIDFISKNENTPKSTTLREVLKKGIKEKKLEIALVKFQKKEATASRAAKIAGIPLTLFLDILQGRNINFHYDLEDLKEDTQDLL